MQLSLYTKKPQPCAEADPLRGKKCRSTLFIIIYYKAIPLFSINTQLSYRLGEYLVYVQYFFSLMVPVDLWLSGEDWRTTENVKGCDSLSRSLVAPQWGEEVENFGHELESFNKRSFH